ncbi:hypothetical protein HDU85_007595 [Gaertneriomyces sp. JEL0708]|nr:hypothetical protein HDU85_007595 [Gaertneriomyces sp. JEL0708]
MSLVKTITSKAEYQSLLQTAGSKLVVIDFTAAWCGPCQMMKPVFAELSTQFRHVVFAQVDVDNVQEVAQEAGVESMPTFQLFKANQKIAELKGANPTGLKSLIQEHAGQAAPGGSLPGGHSDLTEFITLPQVECLNQNGEHIIKNIFNNQPSYLESDVDEQLIMNIPFNQAVKLYAIKIVPASDDGTTFAPKTVKTFVNRAQLIGFDEADDVEPTETLEFSEEDYQNSAIVNLRFVKYQKVYNVNIFVKDNLGNEEITKIKQIIFYGTPVETTNMSYVLPSLRRQTEQGMPELPEVERARRLLHAHALNKVVTEVTTVPDDLVFSNCTNVEFAAYMKGKKVTGTGRHGKVFWLELAKAPDTDGNIEAEEQQEKWLVGHFGMTGSIRWNGATTEADMNQQVKGLPGLTYKDFNTEDENWPPRFTKFVLSFSNSGGSSPASARAESASIHIAFTDPRRLARIRLVPTPIHSYPPVNDLGFDPLLSMPTIDDFTTAVKKRKSPIKALLLDQTFSAGVGNWVADEVLYQARVHPSQGTQTLTDTEIRALYHQLQDVARIACEANAESDKFPKDWLFHHRWAKGKLANRSVTFPNGTKVAFKTIAGRTTAIVEDVQKLHGKVRGSKEESNSGDEYTKSPKVQQLDAASHTEKRTSKRKSTQGIKIEEEEEDQDTEIQHTQKKPRRTARVAEIKPLKEEQPPPVRRSARKR